MEVIRVQEFKGGARETRFVFSPILKLLAPARILMSARSSCCQPILGDRGKVNLSQSIYFGRTRTDLISLHVPSPSVGHDMQIQDPAS